MNKNITFTVFADFHYKKGMYASSVQDLENILQRAKNTNSDFVIHCGDFSNDYQGSPELVKTFLNNKEGLPVYGVYGNHELEAIGNNMEYVTPLLTNRKEEVVWGSDDGKSNDGEIGYYYFDKDSFRIICLDTNYSYNSELNEWQHYAEGSCGPAEGNLYTNSLGPVQLKWLEDLLLISAKEGKHCIIVSHATFNVNWGRCTPDSKAAYEMFKDANKLNPGTVMMVINGHYHYNRISVDEEIVFLDVNTVLNGYWTANGFVHYNNEHTFKNTKYDGNGEFVSSEDATLATLSMSKNTWFFDKPLSAVVNISEDGKIKIEGSKANWIYGIEPENVPPMITPEISDLSIDLKI